MSSLIIHYTIHINIKMNEYGISIIKNNKRKILPDHYSSELRQIVDSLLLIEPHKRLTAD